MSVIDYNKILKKLDNPPGAPNWVCFNGGDIPSTADAIINFLKSGNRITYQPSYSAIRDVIQLGIDIDTALKTVRKAGNPKGRGTNEALVKAFFEYQSRRQYPTFRSISVNKEYFRISRELHVPVSPLSIVIENGKFVPIFLNGWADLRLTVHQRRLLMTIYEDAFLSLTDFQTSPTELLFFPRPEKRMPREAEVWQRGDYDLLSQKELSEAIHIYLEARNLARQILLAEKHEQEELLRHEKTQPDEPKRDLFS